VSAALLRLECNLEDVSTTVLSGHLAMMMVLRAGRDSSVTDLENGLAHLREMSIASAVWDVETVLESAEPTHVLTVYGPDTIGIVHSVSTELAAQGVNVTDMVCRLEEGDPALYVVSMEISIPVDLDAAALEERIRAVCAAMGLDSSMTGIRRAEL
jgi:predicted amino acid-binding ACT domain protein